MKFDAARPCSPLTRQYARARLIWFIHIPDQEDPEYKRVCRESLILLKRLCMWVGFMASRLITKNLSEKQTSLVVHSVLS